MKLAELIKLEDEAIAKLRERSNAGDNDAARVLLEHLRSVSKAISDWQATQPPRKKKSE